ncbi:MAG: MarR family transcriptional regulator [Micrococcales bacterium]|nr:MarR family transcriptional regulator [Micrococcales bacterium]
MGEHETAEHETAQAASEPRWLTPDEMETWRALHLMLDRLPVALGDQLQSDSGLSLVEYYVLAMLSDAPEHTLRMSRLASLANAELSRLSHLMARLEKRGLVRRAPDPSDGRFTNAMLTDVGYAYLVRAAPGHVASVRRFVLDTLAPDAQHALRSAARAITDALGGESCEPSATC